MSDIQLASGILLLAEPFMMDPNFKRAVVLLCDHHKAGDLGFVLNRPMNMGINELIKDFPEFKSTVYYGGPVQTDSIYYVHSAGDILDDSIYVGKGLYWGGDFEKLKFLIQTEIITPKDIKFFIGYSGWSEGQLSEEVSTKSWIKAEMHPNYIFKTRYSNLWELVLHHMGDNYSVLARIPDHISWN